MRLGFELPVAGAWASPPNQQQIAARAVELGYAPLWCSQRLLAAVEPPPLGRW